MRDKILYTEVYLPLHLLSPSVVPLYELSIGLVCLPKLFHQMNKPINNFWVTVFLIPVFVHIMECYATH